MCTLVELPTDEACLFSASPDDLATTFHVEMRHAQPINSRRIDAHITIFRQCSALFVSHLHLPSATNPQPQKSS
jgi:hypothetical protein